MCLLEGLRFISDDLISLTSFSWWRYTQLMSVDISPVSLLFRETPLIQAL